MLAFADCPSACLLPHAKAGPFAADRRADTPGRFRERNRLRLCRAALGTLPLLLWASLAAQAQAQASNGFGLPAVAKPASAEHATPGTDTPSTQNPLLAVYARPADTPEARQRLFTESVSWLKHLDRNHNGTIEPDELSGGKSHSHKLIFESLMQKAGLSATAPASVSEVRQRLATTFGVQDTPPAPSTSPSASSKPGPTPSSPAASVAPSGVPGFGSAAARPPAPGFGPPTPAAAPPAPAAAPPASTGTAASQPAANPPPSSAVLPSGSDTQRALREAAASVAASSNGHNHRRFLTAAERLPAGLPDWFARKDTDGDGQVSLAEYATPWSEELVAEFRRFDANNDGFITPRECLEALKKPVTSASASR